MILRATNHPLTADPARGIADQAVTTPAIPQAGRAISYRTCTKCHAAKPPGMFSREGRHSDRLRKVCKTCRAEQLRQNRRDRAASYHAAPRSGLSIGWLEVNLACARWFASKGLNPCGL